MVAAPPDPADSVYGIESINAASICSAPFHFPPKDGFGKKRRGSQSENNSLLSAGRRKLDWPGKPAETEITPSIREIETRREQNGRRMCKRERLRLRGGGKVHKRGIKFFLKKVSSFI